jgi:hypothetical protein
VAVGLPLSPVIADFFMEDIKERPLAQVTHKLLCWFHYVADTFVIWLHGTEKLERFLDLHRNIRFPLDLEKNGHLIFLDIAIYRILDGSLGQNVCLNLHTHTRAHTHTDIYLNPGSHNHPSDIKAILATSVHLRRGEFNNGISGHESHV